MVDQRIKATFNNTYRDDYTDSAGFYRVLFNNGRAVQARELTQLQTIIQGEITRLGNNLFKEGAAVNPGEPTVYPYQFVKLNTTVNSLPTDTSSIVNTVFTGATSGIKAKLIEAVAAVDSDPATLYVSYTDGLADGSQIKFTPGEDISNGSVTLTVQTTNTTLNPAMGTGLLAGIPGGDFYVTGRFVYAPRQQKIISKYTTDFTGDLGFQIFEEIVTANDDATLYDNSGDLPNTSSPGADRYRIRLELNIRSNMTTADNFVYIAKIRNGIIISDVKAESEDNYKILRDVMAIRTKEESGDYIVKPFLVSFDNNDSDATKLDITVSPGTVYIDGYRANKDFSTVVTVDKPRTTTTKNNEVVAFNIGNYVVANGNKGLPNIDSFELFNLRTATAHGGSTIGTARIRSIEEGVGLDYNIFLFDIQMNAGQNFRDIRSIGTSTTNYWNLVLESGQAVLKDATINSLLFPLPSSRPSSLADISLATQRRFLTTTNGSGEATLTLTASGETFANTNDWLVSLSNSALETGYTITGSGTTTASLSGLPISASNLEVFAYVNKSAGAVRSKTLTETTQTLTSANFDSDGNGLKWVYLNKADIYSFDAIKATDSDGSSIAINFETDNGQRDNYYDLGRLILKGGKSVPATNVFVRYKYFAHGASGDFFAVNSYSGINYEDIPEYTLRNGTTLALRNVIDFRSVVNTSRTFGSGAKIHELPQTNSLVQADATYYMGTRNKLVITTTSDLKFITGKPDLTPAFPETPEGSLELYRITLNPYVTSPADLTTQKIEHKRYTMADIGRLEERIDKIEELTTLSLLELETSTLSVLDSAGLDRTKSGFLVDNFKDHVYSDTANIDHRSAIDPLLKQMRPRSVENAVMLAYDSDLSTNTIIKGDNVYLNYSHRLHINQDAVTGTEKVCPLITPSKTGNILLSPTSDTWMETRYIGDRVINGGVQLVGVNGNAWNSATFNWGGTPVDQLRVGSTTNSVISDFTSSSSSRTANIRSSGFVTSTTTTTTNSSWTSTNQRVASEETVREVIGDRVVDILVIPFMRSRKIYFKGEGFRPNTRLFPFFDDVRVDDWCKAETFQRSNGATDYGNSQNNLAGHPGGSSSLVADASGKIEGSFFIPATANLKFRTGVRPFTLVDVTSGIFENSTSFGETIFTSKGTLEVRQKTVTNTRILTVTTNSTRRSATSTTSTSVVNASRNLLETGRGNDRTPPDPIAQSFTVDQAEGVFVTKFDFYFAAKTSDEHEPVWVELRPMENGIPTGKIIPGSIKYVYPSAITTSTDCSVATTFEFDEPIYLNGGAEYAVVLRANTIDYEVYISRVGEFVLGTTDKKVTKQPFMGSLFKSQNASTWTPSQWEDLTFQMYVAQFTTSTGTVVLENVALPQELLSTDPLSVVNASATVTVYQPAHGFTVGDDVVISGATAFGGLTTGNINGTRTITAVDANGYTFTAGASATSTISGGGSSVLADKNIPADIIIPQITTLLLDGTSINMSGEFTTGQSLAGLETAYQKQSAVDISNGRLYQFAAPRLIANQLNETNNMAGVKSMTINLDLSTTSDYISPVIDMQRATMIALANQIDKQIGSPAAGYNVPLTYVAETTAAGGTHAAKHLTKPITLASDAVGLKVLIGANRPSVASFDVYYRTASGENIRDDAWTLATLESNMPSDENPSIFRQYEYLIGGPGGALPAFNQFQIKIVMKSTNSSKVPVFSDLRAIALGV